MVTFASTLARDRAFVRDLVKTYDRGQLDLPFVVTSSRNPDGSRTYTYKIAAQLYDKWLDNFPSPISLLSQDYLWKVDDVSYSLTQKAFSLLTNQNAIPLVIYIAYGREQSSSLALLLFERLQLAGMDNIFIDTTLVGDDAHYDMLLAELEASDVVIPLITPRTIDNDLAMLELSWLADHEDDKPIIPVWHQGFRSEDFPRELASLGDLDAIRITQEVVMDYNAAIQTAVDRIEMVMI